MENRNSRYDLVAFGTLLIAFLITDRADFKGLYRQVQPEELWLYRYPHKPSIIPSSTLWVIVLCAPLVAYCWSYYLRRNWLDFKLGLKGAYFAICLTGILTNVVKAVVGRPRPDFLSRCYPTHSSPRWDEEGLLQCDGNTLQVINGYRSFPSGHSSLSFSSLFYVTLYLMGKLHVLSYRGCRAMWNLVVCLLPSFCALMIALSRTIDYHHHFEDVLCGSLLGCLCASLAYFRLYPNLTSSTCDVLRNCQQD